MKFHHALFAAFLLVSSAGHAQEEGYDADAAIDAPAKAPRAKQAVKETTPPADYTIAKVDGEAVKFSEVEGVWNSFFGGAAPPDFNNFDEKVKQSVLREVINKRLVYRDAQNQGYERNPEVLKRLEQMKRQLIIQVYVEDKARGLITEDRLKAAYEAQVKKLSNVEQVRARHILVASEAEAKEIAKKLKDGADFAALAKEKSDDKGSGANGGDLGYFTRDKMIPEFSAAAFAMKKDEISAPVKSEFGWHVIKVEDRRKAPVPTYEESKDSLKEAVVNQELDKLLSGMMERARITYYGPDGKEKPFSKKPIKPDAADATKPAQVKR